MREVGALSPAYDPLRNVKLKYADRYPREGSSAAMPVYGLTGAFVAPMPVWKRVMDVCAAAVLLVILSPVFLGVAVLIKSVSPGPVFFKQVRIGYGGKPFLFWKFRTMKTGAGHATHSRYMQQLIRSEVEGKHDVMQKLDNENTAIIRFGGFLRATCLDELPQLINVLRGDMSLVGPRPCLPYEAREFLQWHAGRFDNVPGMTGLWQVSGKNRTTFREMIRYDIRYGNQLSFWLDLKILARTIPAILRQQIDLRSSRREGEVCKNR
jgi:lipopolysaccharide/colanic/teichoic acid biosynthesis glycosyltransferase